MESMRSQIAVEPDEAAGDIEAEYALEAEAACPQCRARVDSVQVIRLLRTRVNFVSGMPRRGQVIVCPSCKTILSGTLGGLL